jgi:hypothetical protein
MRQCAVCVRTETGNRRSECHPYLCIDYRCLGAFVLLSFSSGHSWWHGQSHVLLELFGEMFLGEGEHGR